MMNFALFGNIHLEKLSIFYTELMIMAFILRSKQILHMEFTQRVFRVPKYALYCGRITAFKLT